MIDFTPLLSKPKKPIQELYPFLDDVEGIYEFEHHDRERVLHYMLLAYHPDSPMIERFTSVSQRKEKSAEYAGYTSSDKDGRIKDMLIDHSDPEFLKILHNFLVFINNRVWSMIVSNETTFAEYQLKLITPLAYDGKDKDMLTAATIKGKLMEQMDEINKRLDTYYQRFYMGDEKLVIVGTKKKGITPESIARNHVLQT